MKLSERLFGNSFHTKKKSTRESENLRQYALNDVQSQETFADIRPRLRILIADDNTILLQSLYASLQLLVSTVITAENGQCALELYFAHADLLDVILLDVNMPLADGCTVAKRIRSSGKPRSLEIPIIAMTGDISPHLFNSSCFTGYLRKPFDIDDCLFAIRKGIHSL